MKELHSKLFALLAFLSLADTHENTSGVTKFSCELLEEANSTTLITVNVRKNEVPEDQTFQEAQMDRNPISFKPEVLMGYYFQLVDVQNCYAVLSTLKYLEHDDFTHGSVGTSGELVVTNKQNRVKLNKTLTTRNRRIKQTNPNIALSPDDKVYVQFDLAKGEDGQTNFMDAVIPKDYNHTISVYERNTTSNTMQLKSNGSVFYPIYVPLVAGIKLGTRIKPIQEWEDILCEELVNATDHEGFKVQGNVCLATDEIVVDPGYCPMYYFSLQKCDHYSGFWSNKTITNVSNCHLEYSFMDCGNGYRHAYAKCMHRNNSGDALQWEPTCYENPPIYVESCYVHCGHVYKKSVKIAGYDSSFIEPDANLTFTIGNDAANVTITPSHTININKVIFYKESGVKWFTIVLSKDGSTSFYGKANNFTARYTYNGDLIISIINPLPNNGDKLYKVKIIVFANHTQTFESWTTWEQNCTDRYGYDIRTRKCKVLYEETQLTRSGQYCEGNTTEYAYCSKKDVNATNEGECNERQADGCVLQMDNHVKSTRCADFTSSVSFPKEKRCFTWTSVEPPCTAPCWNHHEILNTSSTCVPTDAPVAENASLCVKGTNRTANVNITCREQNCDCSCAPYGNCSKELSDCVCNFGYMAKNRTCVPSDKWKLLASNVCFGAKNNSYGTVPVRRSGLLSGIRLVHRSGNVICSYEKDALGEETGWKATHFGCNKDGFYANKLAVFITDHNDTVLLPQSSVNQYRKVIYTLYPYNANSKEVVLQKEPPLLILNEPPANELRIWHREDLYDVQVNEHDNNGTSCVDVYGMLDYCCVAHGSCDKERNCVCDVGFERLNDSQTCIPSAWMPIADEVCFGAKNDSYGEFTLAFAGYMRGIKLVHLRGGVTCDDRIYNMVPFGCNDTSLEAPLEKLSVFITKANNDTIWPGPETTTGDGNRHYTLPSYSAVSKQIPLFRDSNYFAVNNSTQLRIWYGDDLADYSESNNAGSTCVRVYGCMCKEEETCNAACECLPGFVLGENYTCVPIGAAKWGLWSSWSDCSVTCGQGTEQKSRKCYPSTKGEFCALDPHNETQARRCDTFIPCPGAKVANLSQSCNSRCQQDLLHCVSIDFNVTDFFDKNVNCSGYNIQPLYPGYVESSMVCSMQTADYSCDNHDNPHGFQRLCNCQAKAEIVYGEWSSWGECSEGCDWGTRSRSRDLIYVDSTNEQHTEPCKVNDCPVSGLWSDWGSWSACSKTCGNGVRSRSRQCDNPPPAYGGLNCPGINNQTQYCGDLPIICPVDGGWSNWSLPLDCDKPCGNGTTKRVRDCNNPAPEFGGKTCVGEKEKLTPCNTHECKKVELNVAVEFIGEDDKYVPGYNNPNSEPSQAYARKIEENMKKMYAEQNISTNFRVVIHEIKEGG